ncbi:MAG: hypothetical protein ABI002_02855 [Saprospiraceae bacterium]
MQQYNGREEPIDILLGMHQIMSQCDGKITVENNAGVDEYDYLPRF